MIFLLYITNNPYFRGFNLLEVKYYFPVSFIKMTGTTEKMTMVAAESSKILKYPFISENYGYCYMNDHNYQHNKSKWKMNDMPVFKKIL